MIVNTQEFFDLLKEIKNKDFAIIGFEGFEIKEKSFLPRMDLIADFSDILKSNNDWDVIKNKLYEITINTFSSLPKDENISYELVFLYQGDIKHY